METLTYIKELDRQFHIVTHGRHAYAYVTQPEGTPYYVFTDGARLSEAGARRHMRELLDLASSDPEGSWRWW